MKVLICDDDAVFAENTKQKVEFYLQDRKKTASVDLATDSSSFMSSSPIYDLAILDIQMEGCSGLEIAKHLQKQNPKIVIFFCTSFSTYQDDAMDLHALRFFEKPLEDTRLFRGLDRALWEIARQTTEVFVASEGEQHRIAVSDVIYVDRKNRKVQLITKGQTFTTRQNFEEWCDILLPTGFCQIHKSILVNPDHVIRYSYDSLEMSNRAVLYIASRRQADFRRFWFEYLRRK